jgi:hypothetical protein
VRQDEGDPERAEHGAGDDGDETLFAGRDFGRIGLHADGAHDTAVERDGPHHVEVVAFEDGGIGAWQLGAIVFGRQAAASALVAREERPVRHVEAGALDVLVDRRGA